MQGKHSIDLRQDFPSKICGYRREETISVLASLTDALTHVHKRRPMLQRSVRDIVDNFASEVNRTTIAYCDPSGSPRILVSHHDESPVYHYANLVSAVFISTSSGKRFNSWAFPRVFDNGLFSIWGDPVALKRHRGPDTLTIDGLSSTAQSVRIRAINQRRASLENLSPSARRRVLNQEKEYRKVRNEFWKKWPTAAHDDLYLKLVQLSRSKRTFQDPILLAIEQEMIKKFREVLSVPRIHELIKATEKKLRTYESPYESMAAIAECRIEITGLNYWRTANFRCKCAARKMLPNGPPSRLLGLRSRSIPVHIKSAVRLRDGAQCKVCGCTKRLDFDHIWPFDEGGPHTLENLRLLCRQCHHRRTRLVAQLKHRPPRATTVLEWVEFERPALRKLEAERSALRDPGL